MPAIGTYFIKKRLLRQKPCGACGKSQQKVTNGGVLRHFFIFLGRPKTWYWAGSKHLRGPHEESVTDFWPHLSENFMPNTIWVYTYNSWADVGGSDTWVKRLSDEGPVWWTYHCTEPKERIFWRKARWSGGGHMDWDKMHKTKSPKAKAKLVLRLRGQAKAKAEV